MKELLPSSIFSLANAIRQDHKGSLFVVGGAVRDLLFNEFHGTLYIPKDIDIEVHGMNVDDFIRVLMKYANKVEMVGNSFSIILARFGDTSVEFSLADKSYSIKDAALRRDFTVNAVLYSLHSHEAFDPLASQSGNTGGIADIKRRKLTLTHEMAFSDDPLRVLRAFQLIARFDLFYDEPVLIKAHQVVDRYCELLYDRVREEWVKWATKSATPSLGLEFLLDSGWIKHYPELQALVGVPQDKTWHPEGDAWNHTMLVVDGINMQSKKNNASNEDLLKRNFSALCHDMGKAIDTYIRSPSHDIQKHHLEVSSDDVIELLANSWRWHSAGHETSGVIPARNFMERLFKPNGMKHEVPLVEHVVLLTRLHMKPHHLQSSMPKEAFVRRLANEIDLRELGFLVDADANGKGNGEWQPSVDMKNIMTVADKVRVADSKPEPILKGKHLIDFGMKPCKQFSDILAQAFDAQLDGSFDDLEAALTWLKTNFKI